MLCGPSRGLLGAAGDYRKGVCYGFGRPDMSSCQGPGGLHTCVSSTFRQFWGAFSCSYHELPPSFPELGRVQSLVPSRTAACEFPLPHPSEVFLSPEVVAPYGPGFKSGGFPAQAP